MSTAQTVSLYHLPKLKVLTLFMSCWFLSFLQRIRSDTIYLYWLYWSSFLKCNWIFLLQSHCHWLLLGKTDTDHGGSKNSIFNCDQPSELEFLCRQHLPSFPGDMGTSTPFSKMFYSGTDLQHEKRDIKLSKPSYWIKSISFSSLSFLL